jgi:hypothetical protein
MTTGTSASEHQQAGEGTAAMSHIAMDTALEHGEVTALGPGLSWIARYQDAWWVIYEHGWLRITDAAAAEDLDQAAVRLAQAEAATKHIGQG